MSEADKVKRRLRRANAAHGVLVAAVQAALDVDGLPQAARGLLLVGMTGARPSCSAPHALEAAVLAQPGVPGPAAGTTLPDRPEVLLAALQRARSALVTRQAQLAACRTCGNEAAAAGAAVDTIETLMKWMAVR